MADVITLTGLPGLGALGEPEPPPGAEISEPPPANAIVLSGPEDVGDEWALTVYEDPASGAIYYEYIRDLGGSEEWLWYRQAPGQNRTLWWALAGAGLGAIGGFALSKRRSEKAANALLGAGLGIAVGAIGSSLGGGA